MWLLRWASRLNVHADEKCTKPPAVKVLDLSMKSARFIGRLKPRLLIHAYRERGACTASMLKYFRKYRSLAAAKARYGAYEHSISFLPVDVMVDMSRERTVEEMIEIFGKYLIST